MAFTLKDFLLLHIPECYKDAEVENLMEAIAEGGFQDIKDEFFLLIYRAAANRHAGEGADTYYASSERPIDVERLGKDRNLFERYSESPTEFEDRVAAFATDVVKWGNRAGLKLELERTGLLCDTDFAPYGILELHDDPQRWILLSAADQALEDEENISHIFKDGVVYNTGKASVTQGTTTVTGSGGAQFVTGGVEAGDIFFNADKSSKMVIESVDDETHLTLAANWPGSTMSAEDYECRPDDPTVRGCRLYEYEEEYFIFLVKLKQDDPPVDYSKDEIKQIIAQVKPAPDKAWVYFPGETYAEEVEP